ncbi:hypothetical protein SK128_004084 [Halocaridina rubra]|uniref:Alpha-glucosidase n=1 Tax=Halocaridina rubra TaxID=373956 RepID=A0AAN8X137_HALRR
MWWRLDAIVLLLCLSRPALGEVIETEEQKPVESVEENDQQESVPDSVTALSVFVRSVNSVWNKNVVRTAMDLSHPGRLLGRHARDLSSILDPFTAPLSGVAQTVTYLPVFLQVLAGGVSGIVEVLGKGIVVVASGMGYGASAVAAIGRSIQALSTSVPSLVAALVVVGGAIIFLYPGLQEAAFTVIASTVLALAGRAAAGARTFVEENSIISSFASCCNTKQEMPRPFSYSLIFLLVATLTEARLKLIVNGNDVLVTYGDVEVFHHTPTRSLLSIGTGRAGYTEISGNFNITDIIDEHTDLDTYVDGSASDTLVNITFTSSTSTELSASLIVQETETGVALPKLSISVISSVPAEYNRLWVKFQAEVDEKVFGGGEQYTYLNLRGYDFPIWTQEQGIGRDSGLIHNVTDIAANAGGDYSTTYWPQASFLSSRHYSLLIHDLHYMVLNFTNDDYHEVYLHNTGLQATMLWGSDLMETVQKVTTELGKQPVLPDWIMTGATLGLQRGTQEMLDYYNLAKSAGVNVSALWIQDWSGTTETLFGHRVYWNWKWNSTYYPGLDTAIDQLAQEGVRVMVYMNPHLIVGGDLYEEADSLGFLLKNDLGDSFQQDFGGFMGGTVDLTSEAARNWYRDKIIQNLIDFGVGGWMADFGEYTRTDMISENSAFTTETLHNALPVEWAKCNREALETSGTLGNAVPFMRSGGLGSSGYQILSWAGDQNVDWSYGDGVASTIVAALNLGLSGMGVTHFDIGGYTTQAPFLKRSKELFLRSAEYAVFTPVMRTHEGNKPESNHQFYTDEETLNQFARLTQIHARLLPYAKDIVQQSSNQGIPVQRPLFLQYEGDVGSWDIMYQYLYGPDLLVAPVTDKMMDVWPVYIPGGDQWIHLWEGTEVTGPQTVVVNTTIGYPPVFYKKDSPWATLFLEIGQEFGP